MLGQDSEVPSALVVFDWASCLLYAFLKPVLDVLTEDDTILPTAALVAAKRIAQAPQVDGVSAEGPERPWPSLPRPAPGHPGEAATSGARASGLLNDWAGPLQTCPERSLNEDFDSYLEACGVAALQALQKAKQFGRVVIITNSGFGWVHETAVRFMPLLLSELEDIPVISARSIFEPLGVQEPYRWKVLCFRRIVDCFTFDASGKTGPSCLISIGDGWQERVAAMIAGQDVEACVKCVKFLEQPGVDQLARELDLCSQVFEGLCGHPSWVDACYSYSKTWGLQLEARADDTSALGGSFAAVEGTVEVVSTDTVEDAGTDHVGSSMTEAEAPVGTPTDGASSDGVGQPEPRAQEPAAVVSPSRKRTRSSRSLRCRSSKATLLARAGKEPALPWHRQYLTMSVRKKVASAASRRLWFQARKKFCKVRSRPRP
ncbi:SIK2 [Symbiodinium sp. CCMP2456]|nr:SIK2 [Symbiodinium sp. CCMP2456]